MELSAFGTLLLEHLGRAGMTRADLARAAGIRSRSVMTNVVKAKGQKGAYAPRPSWVRKWADILNLSGTDRDWFLLSGNLAKCDIEIEAIAVAMHRELKKLKSKASRPKAR